MPRRRSRACRWAPNWGFKKGLSLVSGVHPQVFRHDRVVRRLWPIRALDREVDIGVKRVPASLLYLGDGVNSCGYSCCCNSSPLLETCTEA